MTLERHDEVQPPTFGRDPRVHVADVRRGIRDVRGRIEMVRRARDRPDGIGRDQRHEDGGHRRLFGLERARGVFVAVFMRASLREHTGEMPEHAFVAGVRPVHFGIARTMVLAPPVAALRGSGPAASERPGAASSFSVDLAHRDRK